MSTYSNGKLLSNRGVQQRDTSFYQITIFTT
jgi:hypothetical protein